MSRRPKHYDRPGKRPGPPRVRSTGKGGSIIDQRAPDMVDWEPAMNPRTRPHHARDWQLLPSIEFLDEPPPLPMIHRGKYWSFSIRPDGIWIAPVYNGMFGCRLWHVETIGM